MKSLSVAGGVLLIVYVAAQIGGGVLAYLVGKEWERICEYNDSGSIPCTSVAFAAQLTWTLNVLLLPGHLAS